MRVRAELQVITAREQKCGTAAVAKSTIASEKLRLVPSNLDRESERL